MKINLKSEKLESEIMAVNGKCNAHVLSAYTVRKEAAACFNFLASKLPKNQIIGARFRISANSKKPGAYKWKYKAAVATVEVFPSGLFMVDYQVREFYPDDKDISAAILPDSARAALAEILLKENGVF